jgi:hypothetical protein
MSTWIADYEGNEIRIENSWIRGEKLFVNNKLQDERLSFFSSNLTGHLMAKNGEKQSIKANLSGYFTIGCRLFVNDEKIVATKI